MYSLILAEQSNPTEQPAPVPPWGLVLIVVGLVAVLALGRLMWAARPAPNGSYRVHLIRYRGRLENHGFVVAAHYPTRADRRYSRPGSVIGDKYAVLPDIETARRARKESATPEPPGAGITRREAIIERRIDGVWTPVR